MIVFEYKKTYGTTQKEYAGSHEHKLGIEIENMLTSVGAPHTCQATLKPTEIFHGSILEIDKIREPYASGEYKHSHHYIYRAVGMQQRRCLKTVAQSGETAVTETRH